MKVTGPDGRVWRTGRRWLAWRPRTPRVLALLGSGVVSFSELELLWPVVTVLAVAALPLLVVHLLHWAAALLATPFVVLVKLTPSYSWTVVARTKNRGEYHGTAEGLRAAGELAARVRDEIDATGEPRSLTPPPEPPVIREADLPPFRRWLLRTFPALAENSGVRR